MGKVERRQRVSDAVSESLSSKKGSVDKAIEALDGYVSGKTRQRQIVDLSTKVDTKNENSNKIEYLSDLEDVNFLIRNIF